MKRALAILLLAVLGASAARAAVVDADLELKIKAAFLFNFAKFVDWGPDRLASAEAPIVICVVPPDPFDGILDETVRDKRVGGHPLVVQRIAPGSSLRGCHILYAGMRDPSALIALFASTSGGGVMTIHEANEALPGGVARLFLEENRVRFEINTAAAEREGLQISSKLLSVASVVQR
jgi:hypothetical protein